MTDQFDRAQENDERFQSNSLKRHQENRITETPDEDDHGRYCLTCGNLISQERLNANPSAVRCVPCQSKQES
ncbi:TraR/DksA C4-type zinc finger protein [Aliivibrio fischeri]